MDELGSAPESLLSALLGSVASDQALFVFNFFLVVLKCSRVRNLIVDLVQLSFVYSLCNKRDPAMTISVPGIRSQQGKIS